MPVRGGGGLLSASRTTNTTSTPIRIPEKVHTHTWLLPDLSISVHGIWGRLPHMTGPRQSAFCPNKISFRRGCAAHQTTPVHTVLCCRCCCCCCCCRCCCCNCCCCC